MVVLIFILTCCCISPGQAQINTWQLGGAGAPWSEQAQVDIMVDFADEA